MRLLIYNRITREVIFDLTDVVAYDADTVTREEGFLRGFAPEVGFADNDSLAPDLREAAAHPSIEAIAEALRVMIRDSASLVYVDICPDATDRSVARAWRQQLLALLTQIEGGTLTDAVAAQLLIPPVPERIAKLYAILSAR